MHAVSIKRVGMRQDRLTIKILPPPSITMHAITIKQVGMIHVRRLSDVQEADRVSKLALRITYSAQVNIAR